MYIPSLQSGEGVRWGRAEYASAHEEVRLFFLWSDQEAQAVLIFEAVLLPWSLDFKCKPPQLAFLEQP